jgi:hypothetical protein
LPMRKSAPSLAPVFETENSPNDIPSASWQRWLLRGIGFVVVVYVVVLAVQLVLRAAFPWDLFMWAESPFMTDMLKLDSGQPLFGPPADGNSFVYSPGLTYLTFALLKPLGLHLDIRFCRLVTVGVGILAGILAGLAGRQASKMISPEMQFPRLAWLGAGIAVLVIFKNFNADATHPDNMMMLHTAGLFSLTLAAVRKRSLGLAVVTMLFAGLGVFAKQTLCIAFVGPALVFARFNAGSWRRWLLLAGIGALSSAGALALLWHPDFARFYTWEVIVRHQIHSTRFYWMIVDLLHGDRALLAVLGLAALAVLWRAGSAARQYLQIWALVGLCSVAPGALPYAKHFGTWNNLIIYELWLVMLVLPAIAIWLKEVSTSPVAGLGREPRFNFLAGTVLAAFVVLLVPTRFPADRAMYECCETVQARVTADIRAGHRVLVAHGTMYQLRAGSREIPLDRANSVVELVAAGLGDRVQMIERLRSRYYDRIYLVVEDWYGEAILAEINKNYVVEDVVKKPVTADHSELCRYLPLIGDCKIMSPRRNPP